MKRLIMLTALAAACGLATSLAGAADVDFLNETGALPDGLPFSEAVRVDDTLYLSGQVGVVPGTLELVSGGLEAEARQAMDNIRAVVEASGLAMSDVVKCTVMLADIADWPAFNAIYVDYFEAPFPARSAFATNGLALGARVEVECLAAFAD
jgi:reactive intermediate/imine deaminase